MEENKVCIVGGGASGLTAAIFAAQEGAQVTLLEHNDKVGKKILATGNGKCNLTNYIQEAWYYHSGDREKAWSILQAFSLQDTIRFFSELGVYTKNKNGYLYPSSMQASSVQELLELKARSLKVKIKCREHVTEIRKRQTSEGGGFLVKTETWSYTADRVILACGSLASRIQGADGSGYGLARSLGHSIKKPLPALVPLKGKGNYFSKWAGVRVEGSVSLEAQGHIFDSAAGELQLTDYGVSGIPVFQISGYAARLLDEGVSVTLHLDFMPDFSREGFLDYLRRRKIQCPYQEEKELLLGIFPKKLISVLTAENSNLEVLSGRVKDFPVELTGTQGSDQAQVCSGGVPLEEVRRQTMESKKVPGLYLAGELLDVDGLCGGYNLQWAWSSGALAGKSAARHG